MAGLDLLAIRDKPSPLVFAFKPTSTCLTGGRLPPSRRIGTTIAVPELLEFQIVHQLC